MISVFVDVDDSLSLYLFSIPCFYFYGICGRWFSPGTPASSTTKTSRHDVAEILLKVTLKYQKPINQSTVYVYTIFLSPLYI